MRQHLIISWTAVAALTATGLVAVSLGNGRDVATADSVTEAGGTVLVEVDEDPPPEPDLPVPADPPAPDQVEFVVDPALTPSVSAIPALDGEGTDRPVARLRSTHGTESEVVLGELSAAFHDDDALAAFLTRWNGTVVDVVEPDADGEPTDYLVTVDPSTAPTDRLAADLLALEPHHDGVFAASDARALALMAIAAHEEAAYGTEVSLNWLTELADIRDGDVTEDPSRPNVFDWSWISATKPQQTGIGAAWQLLYGRGGIGNKVRMLIADAGFFPNADFPAEAEIHGKEWRTLNAGTCTNGNPCPFHGTNVVMAAMGRIDNGFATVGPAAPVAELVAYHRGGSLHEQMKAIRRISKDRNVDIVNMSFGTSVTSNQRSTERKYGRWFRKLRDDHGVLAFASAGNNGIDVDDNDALLVPCELEGVVCVGGVDTSDPVARHVDSNFGSKTGGGSVEIYGPYCVVVLENPDVPGDAATKTGCGTSYASPVVAGVAALVMAANPTLGPREVWQIMKDTAHDDPLGAEVTGHRRRVDAYRAVATAMGVPYTLPTLTIEAPTPDDEIGPFDFVDLVATSTNFAGLDLPIQWSRPGGDVVNAVPTTDPVVVGELGPGRHTFIARATDVLGLSATRTLIIDIRNQAPAVSMTSPAANTYRYTVEEVLLDASSSDPEQNGDDVPDANVTWRIRQADGGTVVFEAVGHRSNVPPGTLAAGDYEVVVVAVDADGASSTDAALLTMLDVPAGESLPDASIFEPSHDTVYTTGGGPATVRLRGAATDQQDGALPGTSLRWIAEQDETRIVLCEGGDLADGGTDCSDVTVELPVPPGAPNNWRWMITLEAVDSYGLPGRDSHIVHVQAVQG